MSLCGISARLFAGTVHRRSAERELIEMKKQRVKNAIVGGVGRPLCHTRGAAAGFVARHTAPKCAQGDVAQQAANRTRQTRKRAITRMLEFCRYLAPRK